MSVGDIFTRYAMQIRMDDYIESKMGIRPEKIIETQHYRDSVLITIYRNGSIAIMDSHRQTLKFFNSAAKYWHRTRKIWLRIENQTHCLKLFGEHFADKHSERVMKYYLDRKKKNQLK